MNKEKALRGMHKFYGTSWDHGLEKDKTLNYFEDYWLDNEEYSKKWENFINKFFDRNSHTLPGFMFKEGVTIIAMVSGAQFSKKTLPNWQKVMETMGDKEFVLIRGIGEYENRDMHLGFKYPFDIKWSEMNANLFAAEEFLHYIIHQYYIVGDSGKWARFVANDHYLPLDFIVFEPQYEKTFKKFFPPSPKDEARVMEALPDAYKEKIAWVGIPASLTS